MVQPKITSVKISEYPVRKILRCLMFKNGDAEYPIEECISFVADLVFSHVQTIVQKSIEAAEKRNSQVPEIIDIIFQFRKNPKLLKRLYEYVSLVNASYRMGKVYNVETNSVNDDNDDLSAADDNSTASSSAIAEKVLNAIKKFDVDGKLIDFVTSNVEDASKIERSKRCAARTASMSTEKYQRFADASSYSFLLVGGRSAEKVLNAIKKFDVDGKLIDFVTSNVEDASKIERSKRCAARTASMSTEKYQRFADASSYSFLLVGGRRSELFDAGFRYYTKAPEEFNHDMLIILNFCAMEMMTVLVESAFLKLLKQSQEIGISKDFHKLGAIQLEHYKETAKRIPTKKA
uniref:Uncharacterized protein n=1 Tax=Panagrolaimus sp. ES5 TaxID=591445 RepID=A0AC34FRS8_9BILA